MISYCLVRDTPQSQGLPPIEHYNNDYSTSSKQTLETELTTKEILFKYVLNNKWVWAIAFANIFVYFVTLWCVDWATTYLSEEKQFNLSESGCTSYMNGQVSQVHYYAVTYLINYLRDVVPSRIFLHARCNNICTIYWLNPPGNAWLDNVSLIAIGFLIYGPVMLMAYKR